MPARTRPSPLSLRVVGFARLHQRLSFANHDPFSAPVVIDGQVVGAWKPTSSRDGVAIVLHLPGSTTKSDVRLITDAARRFGKFLGVNVAVDAAKIARVPVL
jgi:hypothetical protein